MVAFKQRAEDRCASGRNDQELRQRRWKTVDFQPTLTKNSLDSSEFGLKRAESARVPNSERLKSTLTQSPWYLPMRDCTRGHGGYPGGWGK